MTTPVRISDVVDALESANDLFRSYLNRVTGEILTIGTDDLSNIEEAEEIDIAAYPAWQRETIRKALEIFDTSQWVRLPDQFEIDEWGIMRDFCYSLDDAHLRAELLDAIHGSGAFRLFKNTVYYRGIREDWGRFRQQALEQIATEWLEENEIPYTKQTL